MLRPGPIIRPTRLSRSAPPARAFAGAAGDTDLRMMARALELAGHSAAEGEVPVGAVVYETATGLVLGEGRNQREAARDPLGHAEAIAIARAARAAGDWRLNHATLVVTLEPCAMCAGAIVNARLGRLIYGARDPKAGCAGSLMRLTEDPRLNHRVVPIAAVLGEQSAELLHEFFRRRRRSGKPITDASDEHP